MTTLEDRVRILEGQLRRLTQDRRIGDSLLGPLPVSDAYMGYRNIGTGRYYVPGTVAAAQDNTRNMAVAANKIYVLPFLVTERVRFDRVTTFTQSGATGNGRMGVYRNGKDLHPSTLVKGSGSVGVGAGANHHDFSPPVSLYRGLYWVAALFSGTPTMFRIPYEQGIAWEILGRDAGIATAFRIGWYADHSFAALPSSYPTAGRDSLINVPFMWIRLIP
jgi:hypothetical protein